MQVYKESSKRAIDEQFGGEDETPPPAPGFTAPTLKLTKYSNAYMLVYIRESSWKDIMLEVSQDDIAEHVRSRLEVGFSSGPCNLPHILMLLTMTDNGACCCEASLHSCLHPDTEVVKIQLLRLKAVEACQQLSACKAIVVVGGGV